MRQKETFLTLKPGKWEDPISELADNTTESKSKKGTEETIEYLSKEVKRDLNSKGTKKLGEPKRQFEKIRIKRQPDGAINICTAIAIPYRDRSEAKTQKLFTKVHEAKNASSGVSKNHYAVVLAKAQRSKDWVYECSDYLETKGVLSTNSSSQELGRTR